MRQYTVPQFIDIESKIIGSISVRQFIILLAGGIVIYLNYELFGSINFWYFGITSLFIFAFTGTLAFLKINGQSFQYFLLNIFNIIKDPRLRVWNKEFSKKDFQVKKSKSPDTKVIAKKEPLSLSHLNRLSLVVDTGGAYKDEDKIFKKSTVKYIKRKKDNNE
ncbi:MAG: PrgI family protein [Patescibacteria group bacterium]|nr:PrgI family protein [Patescibacteria group bacterium]MDZ7799067.1 PrgI family protein [Patescibacteria group bacterium]